MNSSILTNVGAMTALQTLRTVNNDLVRTQDMISTGKKVANTVDNAAVWTISKVMEADITSFESLSDNLGVAQAAVGIARAATEEVGDILNKVYDKITTATADGVDHTAIQAEVSALLQGAWDVMNSAQFNGINLVSGATDMTITNRIERTAAGEITTTNLTITAQNLDATVLSHIDVEDAADARSALTQMETWIDAVNSDAAAFGAIEQRLSSQTQFLSRMTDSMKAGLGQLVDADLEKASARLQALQVQQQLGVQSLSIANQAPQTILSLFR